jgi:hypothetical protein
MIVIRAAAAITPFRVFASGRSVSCAMIVPTDRSKEFPRPGTLTGELYIELTGRSRITAK